MTRLEQIEFETIEKFKAAIDKIIAGDEVFRNYQSNTGEDTVKKIISNNKLYLGNFALRINKATNGKVYLSIDFFSFDDRMEIHKLKNTNNSI